MEGKGPDVVVEITSRTTRRENQKKKWVLYRDVLKVPEYFQFDPTRDYLKPPLQGFRLEEGAFATDRWLGRVRFGMRSCPRRMVARGSDSRPPCGSGPVAYDTDPPDLVGDDRGGKSAESPSCCVPRLCSSSRSVRVC
jgi:hypothetical protein